MKQLYFFRQLAVCSLFFLLAPGLAPLTVQGQSHPLDIFRPLLGRTWVADGTWGDGSSFKQILTFEFQLNDQLVVAKAKGFVNAEQTQFGPRNHGIRQYDAEAQVIRFWEFDVFGQVTEGTVEGKDRDIIYQYDYGGTSVTDLWSYQGDDTYLFTVGVYEDGEWKQKFLETTFRKQTTED